MADDVDVAMAATWLADRFGASHVSEEDVESLAELLAQARKEERERLASPT